MLLLDTTVLIDVLRGRPAAKRLIALREVEEPPATCAINVEELIRGARPSERSAISNLLDGLTIVQLGRTDGERAGDWRRDHSQRGVTLAQADCLIAAVAVGIGARLATGNPKDFPMEGIVVEHWPVGV